MNEKIVKTSVYLDVSLKKEAMKIYEKYGLSLDEAFNMFLAKSVLKNGLPFEFEVPNKETLKAMKDIESGDNYEEIYLSDLKKEN